VITVLGVLDLPQAQTLIPSGTHFRPPSNQQNPELLNIMLQTLQILKIEHHFSFTSDSYKSSQTGCKLPLGSGEPVV